MMNREYTRSIRSRRKSTRSMASAGGSRRIHAVRLARGFFGWGSSGCFSSFAGEGFGSGPRRVHSTPGALLLLRHAFLELGEHLDHVRDDPAVVLSLESLADEQSMKPIRHA